MGVETRQMVDITFTDPKQEDLAPELVIRYSGKHNVSVQMDAPWDEVTLCEDLSVADAVSLLESYANVFKAGVKHLKGIM